MTQFLPTGPLPGTRDFFPEEMSVRQLVFAHLYEVVESYGYLRYDAPMLEPFELYASKSSEEIVAQQTYRMTDRGGRDLVMRPEMTPSVARMIAACAGKLQLPARWYSHPNLWRYERKQRGRYREHWQVNVDLFGTESWEAEAEIFEILAEMMFSVGAKTSDFVLRVSDRALVRGALTANGGVPEEKLDALFGALDQFEKLPVEESKKIITALGLDAERVVATITAPEDEFLKLAPTEVALRSNVARVIREGLVTSQPVQLKFDPLIIRGFTYYTSSVFEIFDTDPENRRSIAGGGRYDNLVGLFGKQRIPGIGFGMGDVTLIDFLHTHQIAPAARVGADVQVISPDPAARGPVKQIAHDLRRAGLRVVTPLEPKKLGKQLEKAAREGVRCAVIAGPDELARGAVKLRDLARSEEREVLLSDLAAAVKQAVARSVSTEVKS
ncbi:MAG: histidine--tRNA ligase [Myxococcales bacterium]|nr:histidine--tRNA ligase [Myxococcales bacterium]